MASNLSNQEYFNLYGNLSEERISKLLSLEEEFNSHECELDCDECHGLERSLDDIYYLVQEFDEQELVNLQQLVNNEDIDEISQQVDKVVDMVSLLLHEIKLSI